MSASLNRCTIIGPLGRDPEVKFIPSGKAVCKFSVATTEKWKDEAGEKKEATTWHNVVVWGPLAETCGQYLAKGRLVYVEGPISTRSYDKDGQKRYVTEITAKVVQFLGGGERREAQSNAAPAGEDDRPF